eukprot:m51a1_g1100 putative protein tyrosine kinase domain containing protein (520) ;mRNA; r:108183-110956
MHARSWVGQLLAAALVCLHAVRAEDQCGGEGSLVYDSGADFTLMGRTRWPLESLCGSYAVYSANVGQLFTPPSVPWKFTRVCFALYLEPYANTSVAKKSTVYGAVSLYPMAMMPIYGPGERLSYTSFRTVVRYDPTIQPCDAKNTSIVPTWVSVDLSGLDDPMVAWNKGVVIGVSFWSCGKVRMVGTKLDTQHLIYDFSPVDAVCRCVALDWEKKGACNASNYWQYDGCQCECGVVTDPDCNDKNVPVSVCPGHFIQPYCHVLDSGAVCEEKWKCNASAYNDGKICDCECGISDPDCFNYNLNTTLPREWTCDTSWYMDHRGCDCKCGAYELDCDNVSLPVYRCGVGFTCNYAGNCVLPGCGNGRVDLTTDPKEECDGGVGCEHCKCTAGYYPKSPMRLDCEPHCGDNVTMGDEHPRTINCSGCGNGVLDTEHNESCDGGVGCNDNCACKDGWAPTSPLSKDCESLEKTESKSNRNKIIISSTVGSVGGFILLVGVVIALVYARKVRNGPRQLNVPNSM